MRTILRGRPDTTMMTHRLRSPYRTACSAATWAALGHGLWDALSAAPQLPAAWAAAAYLMVIGGAAATAARTERVLWSTAPPTTALGLSVLALTPVPVWPGLGVAVLVVVAVAALRLQEDFRAPFGQVLIIALASIAAVPLHLVLAVREALRPGRNG